MSTQEDQKQGAILDIIVDIVAIMTKIGTALENHEQRLHSLESLNLKTQLLQLKRKIKAVSDPKIQEAALSTLKDLCELLGIQDIERMQ